MKHIYSLKYDSARLKSLTQASQSLDPRLGLSSKNGVIGSEEWWKNINEGKIVVRLIEGRITRVFISGHNDFPEFEMNSDGKISIRECLATKLDYDRHYEVGKTIVIRYAEVYRKGLNTPHELVLDIWGEDERER